MTSRDPNSDYSALQKPLEHFRANTKRLKVHPKETALLGVVGAALVFDSWAIGGMRLWSQVISILLSALSLMLSLLPRHYTEEHTGSNRFRLVMWPRLLRFPLFWLGLALLGLVIAQALNPAWAYKTDGKVWWMKAVGHITSLPVGVEVPFDSWGPWRILLVYSSVWLTVCAVWTGFTRRRTVQVLFSIIAGNGLALAILGVAQKLLGAQKIFWSLTSASSAFFASFVYKNHAGAYLFLTLAVTCGLAAWYYLRGLRRMEKSNPSGVLAFFATCIAISILVSYARGATLIMLAFLCTTITAFFIQQFASPTEHRNPLVAVVLVLIFGVFLKTGLGALHSQEAWTRIKEGITREDPSLASRELATTASEDMLRDYWIRGAGAGSFRFLFPVYQQRYPRLVEVDGQRMYWEHAHNDILEFPIELGLIGTLLVLASAGYAGLVLVRGYFWQNPLSASVIFGCFLLVVYGWWDFPFQNPAILLTWCVLVVAAMMWTSFEELNVKG